MLFRSQHNPSSDSRPLQASCADSLIPHVRSNLSPLLVACKFSSARSGYHRRNPGSRSDLNHPCLVIREIRNFAGKDRRQGGRRSFTSITTAMWIRDCYETPIQLRGNYDEPNTAAVASGVQRATEAHAPKDCVTLRTWRKVNEQERKAVR